ncbi:MAG: sulfatase, partial [Pseudomonadota bacterium]
PEELKTAKLANPFSFTKEVPLLRVPVIDRSPMYNNYGPGSLLQTDTVLFDLERDPGQTAPLDDPAVEARLMGLMRDLMLANDCPPEALARIGLEASREPA